MSTTDRIKRRFVVNAPSLLNSPQAAEFLNLKPKTLARWRWAGKGPRYHKLHGAVRYSVADLAAFVDQSARTSTSDPGSLTIQPAQS